MTTTRITVKTPDGEVLADYKTDESGDRWPAQVPSALTLNALVDVKGERQRQEDLRASGKFSATCATAREDGGMNDFQCLAVLGEEFGEVARAVCESIEGNIENRADLREELIQVAAVAVAWVERLDAMR